MADVAILIPAAGASSRMRGRDKLLEPVEGESLLARQLRVARATGARVIVTLPPGDRGAARQAALDSDAEVVVVPDAAEGMAASLRAGVAALSCAGGILVLLADLPEITADDLTAMLVAFRNDPERILRAAAKDGTPGHPVIFPQALFPDLATLSGDEGARKIVREHPHRFITLPGQRAVTDLDTPEDWSAWRARLGD